VLISSWNLTEKGKSIQKMFRPNAETTEYRKQKISEMLDYKSQKSGVDQ